MGNFVGYTDEFYADDLGEMGNAFINAHRQEWDAFMVNFRRALDGKSQAYMDQAIDKIRPALDSYNTDEDKVGESIWNELYQWLIKHNKKENFYI